MERRKSCYHLFVVILIVFISSRQVCCKTKMTTDDEEVTPLTTSNSIIRPSVEKSEDEVRAGMALLEGTDCGKSDAANKTVNFADIRDVNLSEYPWMALLVYLENGIHRTLDCGGTLIHPRHVLTAAHCIRLENKKLVSVRLGEHDIDTTEDCKSKNCAPEIQEIDVEQAIYHKGYNPSTKYYDDIGIVRLVRNAVINSNVKPICLPITLVSRDVGVNHNMLISGWGRVERGIKSKVLQKAAVQLRIVDYCQLVHRLTRITWKQLCVAGSNVMNTCKSDIGGPIFFSGQYTKDERYIQYGLVTAGSALCGSMYPGIYLKVEAYLPWIAGNLI